MLIYVSWNEALVEIIYFWTSGFKSSFNFVFLITFLFYSNIYFTISASAFSSFIKQQIVIVCLFTYLFILSWIMLVFNVKILKINVTEQRENWECVKKLIISLVFIYN